MRTPHKEGLHSDLCAARRFCTVAPAFAFGGLYSKDARRFVGVTIIRIAVEGLSVRASIQECANEFIRG